MKKIITLLSGSILYLSAFSQTTNTTVKGNVSDANNNPLQTVTVSLLKAKDSSLVKVEITNQQGAFSIKANTGKYLVSYNIIGFEKKFSEPFTLADNQTPSFHQHKF